MSTLAQISRTQAWCKLVVLIAYGLPAPRGIDFHPDGKILCVTVDTLAAFDAWSAAIGSTKFRRHDYPDGYTAVSLHNDDLVTWNGYSINLTAYLDRGTDVRQHVDIDDLSKVREVAADIPCSPRPSAAPRSGGTER